MKYWLISGHMGKAYFIADDDDYALEHVEDTCEMCGDHDFIEESFSNLKEAKKLIKKQNYDSEYTKELIQEAAELLSKSE